MADETWKDIMSINLRLERQGGRKKRAQPEWGAGGAQYRYAYEDGAPGAGAAAAGGTFYQNEDSARASYDSAYWGSVGAPPPPAPESGGEWIPPSPYGDSARVHYDKAYWGSDGAPPPPAPESSVPSRSEWVPPPNPYRVPLRSGPSQPGLNNYGYPQNLLTVGSWATGPGVPTVPEVSGPSPAAVGPPNRVPLSTPISAPIGIPLRIPGGIPQPVPGGIPIPPGAPLGAEPSHPLPVGAVLPSGPFQPFGAPHAPHIIPIAGGPLRVPFAPAPHRVPLRAPFAPAGPGPVPLVPIRVPVVIQDDDDGGTSSLRDRGQFYESQSRNVASAVCSNQHFLSWVSESKFRVHTTDPCWS